VDAVDMTSKLGDVQLASAFRLDENVKWRLAYVGILNAGGALRLLVELEAKVNRIL